MFRPFNATRAAVEGAFLFQRQARKLAVAFVYTLLSACIGGGDDGPGTNINTLPGNDGGAPGAQPSATVTPTQPGTGEGQQPAGMGGVMGAGSTPLTPGTSPMGGSQTPGGGTMGGGAPPDLGQNSQGDTFFRADTLQLKAPKLYATLLILRTEITSSAQDALNTLLTGDAESDGFVDMSLLLRFLKTANPKTSAGQVTPGGAICPFPIDPSKACQPDKTFPFQTPALAYMNGTAPCTLQGAPESAPAPCFVTNPASLTMQLPILGAVPLQDGQIAATWDGTNISNGWVRGFLPKAVAAATLLGDGIPPIYELAGAKKGVPLLSFLMDNPVQMNSRGEEGWWFLLSFSAKPATFNPALATP